MLWHWKLSYSMYHVQELMHPQEASVIITEKLPVIKVKFETTSSCAILLCTTCQIAKAKHCNQQVQATWSNPDKNGVLSWDKHKVRNFISADQFVINTCAHLPLSYNQEVTGQCYHSGIIYYDKASDLIFVECQVSLSAGESVMSKIHLEEWLGDLCYSE